MRDRRSSSSTRSRRWVARWALRVLGLVLAIHLTGALHVFADAFLDDTDVTARAGSSPSPDDEDGDHCPPGCPSCHCAGECTPFVPPPVPMPVVTATILQASRFEPGSLVPPTTETPPLYRPPRA